MPEELLELVVRGKDEATRAMGEVREGLARLEEGAGGAAGVLKFMGTTAGVAISVIGAIAAAATAAADATLKWVEDSTKLSYVMGTSIEEATRFAAAAKSADVSQQQLVSTIVRLDSATMMLDATLQQSADKQIALNGDRADALHKYESAYGDAITARRKLDAENETAMTAFRADQFRERERLLEDWADKMAANDENLLDLERTKARQHEDLAMQEARTNQDHTEKMTELRTSMAQATTYSQALSISQQVKDEEQNYARKTEDQAKLKSRRTEDEADQAKHLETQHTLEVKELDRSAEDQERSQTKTLTSLEKHYQARLEALEKSLDNELTAYTNQERKLREQATALARAISPTEKGLAGLGIGTQAFISAKPEEQLLLMADAVSRMAGEGRTEEAVGALSKIVPRTQVADFMKLFILGRAGIEGRMGEAGIPTPTEAQQTMAESYEQSGVRRNRAAQAAMQRFGFGTMPYLTGGNMVAADVLSGQAAPFSANAAASLVGAIGAGWLQPGQALAMLGSGGGGTSFGGNTFNIFGSGISSQSELEILAQRIADILSFRQANR